MATTEVAEPQFCKLWVEELEKIRSEVLTVTSGKMTDFCDVALCRMVDIDRRSKASSPPP
jgi:hypothetical protein